MSDLVALSCICTDKPISGFFWIVESGFLAYLFIGITEELKDVSEQETARIQGGE